MKYPLALALLILIGCDGAQPTTPRIFLGQSMAEASHLARSHGYTLHDASGLAMEPAPDGFYTAIASDHDLLVLQDDSGNVASLTIITNPAKPKSQRVYRAVEEYVLPASSGEPPPALDRQRPPPEDGR